MDYRVIATDSAPGAIGPYSQGFLAGKLLFISGQLPIKPDTGELVFTNIREATRVCMDNIMAIAAAAGSGVHLIKVTIFLRDMNVFGYVNEEYGKYFSEAPPARACVEVSALPRNAPIEIEAVAMLP